MRELGTGAGSPNGDVTAPALADEAVPTAGAGEGAPRVDSRNGAKGRPKTAVRLAGGRGGGGVGSPVRIDQPVTWLIGLWLLVVAAVAIVALLDLWSAAEQVQQLAVKAAAPGTANPQPLFPTISVLQLQFTLTPDLSIILLAMVCGVLGSLVHVFTRLTESGGTNHGTDHPPRGRDALWFVAAPIQGGLLAFLAIAAVAAGLLSTGQSSSSFSANLFTVAAIAGLTGLFTKRMTVRLAAIINGVTGIRTSTLPAGNLPPPNGAAPQPRPDASEPSPH